MAARIKSPTTGLWTNAEVARLHTAARKKMTARQIGNMLRRTPEAIQGKARRQAHHAQACGQEAGRGLINYPARRARPHRAARRPGSACAGRGAPPPGPP
jgi:IS30 family transposase